MTSAFLALLAAWGCRHSAPSPDATRATGSATQPANTAPRPELASELCEIVHTIPATRKAACCGTAPEAGLVNACRSELAAAPAARIDATRLAACRSAMLLATTGCDWVTPFQGGLPSACRGILRGDQQASEPCRSSLECRAPLHCEGASPSRSGKCEPPGENGETCGTEVDALATFTRQGSTEAEHPLCRAQCSFIDHRCAEVPSVGASCYSRANCAPSQLCVAGRCAPATAAGDGQSCASTACAAGLRCVGQLCRPLARPTEPCETDADCASGGCVDEADGARRCAMKCSASLSALRSSATPTMPFPLRPRDAKPR